MFMIGYTINYEWFFSVCLGRRLRLANLIHVNNGKEIQRKFFFNKEGTFSVNTCVLKINFHVILKLLLVMTNNLSYCYNKLFSKYKLSVQNTLTHTYTESIFHCDLEYVKLLLNGRRCSSETSTNDISWFTSKLLYWKTFVISRWLVKVFKPRIKTECTN